jgi:hypothetical protein
MFLVVHIAHFCVDIALPDHGDAMKELKFSFLKVAVFTSVLQKKIQ